MTKQPGTLNGKRTVLFNKWCWKSCIDTCKTKQPNHYLTSVQSLSHVQLFETPWTAARQASVSITNSQSSLTPCWELHIVQTDWSLVSSGSLFPKAWLGVVVVIFTFEKAYSVHRWRHERSLPCEVRRFGVWFLNTCRAELGIHLSPIRWH